MSNYLSDRDKACVAYLMGRITGVAEGLDDAGHDGAARLLVDVVALRKLLLPETGRPREEPEEFRTDPA
jgi:hypothetical protein